MEASENVLPTQSRNVAVYVCVKLFPMSETVSATQCLTQEELSYLSPEEQAFFRRFGRLKKQYPFFTPRRPKYYDSADHAMERMRKIPTNKAQNTYSESQKFPETQQEQNETYL
jgi:hypothetical protein